jgi:hypothetical protein
VSVASRDATGTQRGDPGERRAERQPVTRDVDAGAQQRRVIGEGEAAHHPRRASGEGDLDRLGRVDAPGKLQRRRDPRRDRPEDLHVDRGAAPSAVEIDHVDERRTEPDEMLCDPIRSIGRRADAGGDAGPEHHPRSAALDVDGRDDLHRLPAELRSRRGPALAEQGPAVEADWQRAAT